MLVTEKSLRNVIDLTSVNDLLADLPGFSLFGMDQVLTYLMDPTIFSLSFNKEPGKGYLYGLDIAKQRRRLHNSLPVMYRKPLMISRLQAHSLCDSVLKWIGHDTHVSLESLLNCYDIGMGSSVYCLDFPSQSCVIKPVQSVNGSFYSHVLSLCQYPFIALSNFSVLNTFWQLSSYLEGVHFNEFYYHHRLNDILVQQLATHACLGDVFGRGDRHFENYLVADNTIYPIDVSYLFWPDNDKWLDCYIAGGQSECCLLVLEPAFKALYWDAYQQTFSYLQSLKDQFVSAIQSFYLPAISKNYESFLLTRLQQDDYVKQRMERVEGPLREYQFRLEYKYQLEKRVNQDGLSSLDPMLKMYYYANKDRLTAFFLMDYFKRKSLLSMI